MDSQGTYGSGSTVAAGGAIVGGLPQLDFSGPQLDPSKYIAEGTSWRVTLAWIAIGVLSLVLTLSTFGAIWLFVILGVILRWWMMKRLHTLLHGSGIHVNDEQFPELWSVIKQMAARVGLKELPQVYIVEDATANGAAFKLGKAHYIMLTDNMIHGPMRSGDFRMLGFVLAHELAHIALGHTAGIRGVLGNFPALRRLDELSADALSAALINDRNLAIKAIALLTVGPELLPSLNLEALARQAREVAANQKAWKKAEQPLSHPLLLRRIALLLASN